MFDEKDVIARAIKAWNRFCRTHGIIASEPSAEMSEYDVEEMTVILRNVNGTLAYYSHHPLLNTLRRWKGAEVRS